MEGALIAAVSRDYRYTLKFDELSDIEDIVTRLVDMVTRFDKHCEDNKVDTMRYTRFDKLKPKLLIEINRETH